MITFAIYFIAILTSIEVLGWTFTLMQSMVRIRNWARKYPNLHYIGIMEVNHLKWPNWRKKLAIHVIRNS